MDAVRRRDESAFGPDLAGVLGDGERLVPPPEESQAYARQAAEWSPHQCTWPD